MPFAFCEVPVKQNLPSEARNFGSICSPSEAHGIWFPIWDGNWICRNQIAYSSRTDPRHGKKLNSKEASMQRSIRHWFLSVLVLTTFSGAYSQTSASRL